MGNNETDNGNILSFQTIYNLSYTLLFNLRNSKPLKLFPAIGYFVLFMGCSTNYMVKEFGSKDDYYKYFNNHAGSKELNIKLKSDANLAANLGAKIKADSLQFDTIKVKADNEEISLNTIKSIDYNVSDLHSAHLSLKNGRELNVQNMIFKPNSLQCKAYEDLLISQNISLNSIKEISYISRWKCVIPGLLSGVLLGGIFGATGWVINIKNGGMQEKFDPLNSAVLGAFIGGIIGPVVGYILGWKTGYHFD